MPPERTPHAYSRLRALPRRLACRSRCTPRRGSVGLVRRELSESARKLVERDRAGGRDVQRLGGTGRRDRRLVASRHELLRQPLALGAEQERQRRLERHLRRAARRRARRARPSSAAPRPRRSSGTRKIAPADARSARGPSGSAHSGESATPAPNASAVRSSVPTFPGSATCQSASTTSRAAVGRSARPVDADHPRRHDRASRPRRAARERRSHRRRGARPARCPAAAAASTRSSLSTAKSPVSSRCLRPERSFRTSRSFSFWRDSIRPLLRARPSPARRPRRTPSDRSPRYRRATCGRARCPPSSRRP